MSAPSRVGVLGGGRMGSGIAHAFALAGAEVVIVEADETAAAAARGRIAELLGESRRREVPGVEAAIARLAVEVGAAAFAGCELVVEAVPEIPELKADALRMIETQLSDDAWIATNTSSLSIASLARALDRPDRFCGLHFFNPVPASALVEIVRGPQTDSALIERARGWVELLGKTPIVASDTPGFASSRLGIILFLEAVRMVADGVASAEDIDTAMVLGYRHQTGPLRTADLVGLDVRLAIADYLEGELGERFRAPALLRSMVARGELGKKSGVGFYTWGK